MHKRILVYYSILNIGGAERSLARLMNALSRDGNCVTFLANYGNGMAETDLDSGIRKLAFSVSNKNLGGKGIVSLFRRIYVTGEKTVNKFRMKRWKESYDLVIYGSHGMNPARIRGIFASKAEVKCIRSDMTRALTVTAKRTVLNHQKDIDYYLCVSKTVKESFDCVFPQLSHRSFVLYNFLETEKMIQKIYMSNNPYPDDGKIHIVTVCRISDMSKGVFRMAEICEQLLSEGYNFDWYLVGDGDDLPELRRRLETKGINDRFITVGRKNNPFGYYRFADLVAVLSYYEGLCGTVNEAKLSGAAVIATKFSGIHEQLVHGKNGWIVDNSTEGILTGMRELLSNPELLREIRNNKYPPDITDDSRKLAVLYEKLGWN